VQVALMRIGSFYCRECQKLKLESEAEQFGCQLIGAGTNAQSRKYRLPCGHEQVIFTSCMREGRFRCQTCLENKLNAEAELQGCQLVGPGKDANRRLYRFPCGHLQEIQTGKMREGAIRCQTCLEDRWESEARAQGCEILGEGRDYSYFLYRLPCGHSQEIKKDGVRRGGYRCQTCLENKFTEEAEMRGAVILGPGKDNNSRNYLLECGHEQSVRIENMRDGYFRCQTCEDYAYTQPSNVYLVQIKIGVDEWLKLGFAKNVDSRTRLYGLPLGAEVTVLATRPFETGKEAAEFERLLHRKHKRKRLRRRDMKEFFTRSGFTECYPLKMVETLLAEFKTDQ
jgi:hypothetical protein